MSHKVDLSILSIESLHLPGRQTDLIRPQKIIQVRRICRPRNGSNPRFSRKHPYEGKLRRCQPLAFGPATDKSNERHVMFQRFGRKLRQVPPAIALMETAVFVDHTGQEGTSQWTIRYEADTEFFECRKDLRFGFTPPNGIFALHGRQRTYGMSAANGTRAGFRESPMQHLTLLHQLLNRPRHLLHRNIRIDAMLIQQVDVIRTQTP